MSILFIFTLLGLITFMLSGALVAIKNEMDLGGVIILSAITGLGGGTIRDILLQIPIFWMENNWYIYLAGIIGTATFSFYHILNKHITHIFLKKTLFLFDILGTTSFIIITVSTSKIHNQSLVNSILLSVITCIGGGILQDIICGEIPSVFRNKLSATSVALSSCVYIVMDGYNPTWAVILSCLLLVGLRSIERHYNLSLPRKPSASY